MAKDRSGQESWARRPKDDDLGIIWPILRVPPKGKHIFVILSHDLLGCYTHFWRGRTEPCLQEQCPPCDDNSPRRWHGWLAVRGMRSGSCYILEITARGSTSISAFFDQHRTLRGHTITVHRYPEKLNGRVHATLTANQQQPADLPAAIDIKEQLLRMWSTGRRAAAAPRTSPAQPPGEREHIQRLAGTLNDVPGQQHFLNNGAD